MSRSVVLGLTAAVTCLSLAGVSQADHAAGERATVIIRATGHTGSIEHVRSTDRDALAPDVLAGSISRNELRAELGRGIGRFLQNVKTEAVLSHGHFIGWRVLALFPKRTDVQVKGIKAGDVLVKVNGQSVERPEDFKSIWDSLDTAKELILDIERDGQPSALRYSIVD
jgi:type II secretory pathway component PulC